MANTTSRAVDDHFDGKAPAVRATYDRLLNALNRLGPVIEEPKKTSIHLVNASAFGGVATRKDYLILTIKSDRKLASKRFRKSEQVSANRYHYEINLATPKDVDRELMAWLKASYELSGARK